jgi:hypothetical protein
MTPEQVNAAWGRPDATTDAGATVSMAWSDGRAVGFRDGHAFLVAAPAQ